METLSRVAAAASGLHARRYRSAGPLAWAILLLSLVPTGGCNWGDRPDLGQVKGTILVDGKPASDVTVSFTQIGFRASRGLTDEQGNYELVYIKGVKGAVLGEHRVELRYYATEAGPKQPQLPAKYNSESELTRRVERGLNQIDFELTTAANK